MGEFRRGKKYATYDPAEEEDRTPEHAVHVATMIYVRGCRRCEELTLRMSPSRIADWPDEY